jgi:enoyl-CoA hydratase/carnithine racemase
VPAGARRRDPLAQRIDARVSVHAVTPAAPYDIRLDRTGPVATITLCRPDVLNAQTPAMWEQMREYDREIPGEVRVVVVRGEGRAFSAGLDRTVALTALGEMAALPAVEAEARIAGYQQAFSWLRRPDLVTIAAVQGHAIGAGFQLALACDLRILTEDAQLSMAEVTLGLVPDLTGTDRLVALVGYARALEFCLTARRIGAAEAQRLGLANAVVPDADLDRAVEELTGSLLAADRSAVIEIKALLSGAGDRNAERQWAAERAAQLRRIRDLAGLDD